MTVKELVALLRKQDSDKEVEVTTEGVAYPALEVNYIEDDGVVEIACGWSRLYVDEDN